MKEEDYVSEIMRHLEPKFSILPKNPYTTIVGLVEPTNLEGVATAWKYKFKSIHGHTIMEDERVLAMKKD
mgnify:CR=1 FL=1